MRGKGSINPGDSARWPLVLALGTLESEASVELMDQSTGPRLRQSKLAGTACLIVALLAAWPVGASAGEIEGVRFSKNAEIAGTKVPLRGFGLLRYRLLIKAYVAAFYASEGSASASPLESEPRRLEIEYFWSLSAQQFGEATREGMAGNLSPSQLAALEPRIQQMNALYEDIEPGDRYALTYVGSKTELSKNGRLLGSVPGADFGRAMFGIWLGDRPLSPGLKTQLLSTGE